MYRTAASNLRASSVKAEITRIRAMRPCIGLFEAPARRAVRRYCAPHLVNLPPGLSYRCKRIFVTAVCRH